MTEQRILTRPEVLELLSDQARAGSVTAAIEAIYRHFGDFARALLAAGMIPATLGRRRERWSAAEAARACRSFRRRNGRWPDWGDVKRSRGELPSSGVMIRYFGSTREAEVRLGAEAILSGAEGEPEVT